MPGKEQRRPMLSRTEILGLAVIFIIGILIALPSLKDTYFGAFLSGKCEHNPKPPACDGQVVTQLRAKLWLR
jgi:hypothetical protein